ncbi:MAG: class I tRNA ligase family protein [Candidatus Peribacteria bacterium]|nr:class I tRNA ligase family protein [Candidatus Peribacteria bacterium]
MGNTEVVEFPTYTLTNDLDKRILAELNKTMKEVDTHLQNYILDEATKSATDFMDKLTNRRLRRSRRRFRSNGMNNDKHAAYATLYRVLKRYLQILAPFAPFITEHLRLTLTPFRKGGGTLNEVKGIGDLVDQHKTPRPNGHPPYKGGQ